MIDMNLSDLEKQKIMKMLFKGNVEELNNFLSLKIIREVDCENIDTYLHGFIKGLTTYQEILEYLSGNLEKKEPGIS